MTASSGKTRISSDSGGGDVLRPKVNARFWFDKFQKSMINAIIEMIKNAFDWQASVVKFTTNESRTEIRYVDDGRGMNEANRLAFISIGESTAAGDQSGTFGTGAQYLIFTYASYVRLVTAPESDPDRVFILEFTPEELADAYAGIGGIHVQNVEKSTATWPHEHRFGTDIRYTLRSPNSGSIRRDDRLARDLSDRLDNVLVDGGMVLVNGKNLPSKTLAPGSRSFSWIQPAEADPPMGRIRLEFYRPARQSSVEDLRMTDRSIGEVSFRKAFIDLLTDDQKNMVPPLFLEGEVCGLISAGFLHDHVDESRDRYKPVIADDERVNELLRILNRVEVDVAGHLGIKLRQMDTTEAHGREEISELIERFQQRFNPGGELPEGFGDAGDAGTESGPSNTPGRQPPTPTREPRFIIGRSEFALGETISVRLSVPDGDPASFIFRFDQAKAKVESQSVGQAELIADEVGKAIIRAINPQTGASAQVEYEVLLERRFHLSARGPFGIKLGSPFTVEALNTDLLAGPVQWKLRDGSGELKVVSRGLAARFTPTKTGRAQIVAFDSANPSVNDACDIRVLPGQDRDVPFRIRDQYFVVEITESNLHAYRKPVTILKAAANEIHRMVVNPLAPGYRTSIEAGTLQTLLAHATAFEFAKHFTVDWEEADASDFPSLMLELQNDAAVLLQEMLED